MFSKPAKNCKANCIRRFNYYAVLISMLWGVNPLTPGVHQKVIHTFKNLQLKATDLFQFVWPFNGHKALRGENKISLKSFYSLLVEYMKTKEKYVRSARETVASLEALSCSSPLPLDFTDSHSKLGKHSFRCFFFLTLNDLSILENCDKNRWMAVPVFGRVIIIIIINFNIVICSIFK